MRSVPATAFPPKNQSIGGLQNYVEILELRLIHLRIFEI